MNHPTHAQFEKRGEHFSAGVKATVIVLSIIGAVVQGVLLYKLWRNGKLKALWEKMNTWEKVKALPGKVFTLENVKVVWEHVKVVWEHVEVFWEKSKDGLKWIKNGLKTLIVGLFEKRNRRELADDDDGVALYDRCKDHDDPETHPEGAYKNRRKTTMDNVDLYAQSQGGENSLSFYHPGKAEIESPDSEYSSLPPEVKVYSNPDRNYSTLVNFEEDSGVKSKYVEDLE